MYGEIYRNRKGIGKIVLVLLCLFYRIFEIMH